MNIEGQINISIEKYLDGSNKVEIISSREMMASHFFIGKNPNQVLSLIGMVYSLCGYAQTHAAYLSLKKAHGEIPCKDDPVICAYKVLTLVESAREHLCRILIDWNSYLGSNSNLGILKPIMKMPSDIEKLIFIGGLDAYGDDSHIKPDIGAIEEIIDKLELYLKKNIFMIGTEKWLQINSEQELIDWLKGHDCMIRKLINTIYDDNLCILGRNLLGFLPLLDEDELDVRFSVNDADEFISKPTWQDEVWETTVLARKQNHPLIHSIIEKYGNGLFPRMLARLSELASIPSSIRELLRCFDSYNKNKLMFVDNKCSGVGISQVEAVRGRLVHRAEIVNGIVSNYQILAPTEWNFHPNGLVAKSLENIDATDEKTLRYKAERLIREIDPCVDYKIAVKVY